MKKTKKQSAGFTLIETMVVFFILAILTDAAWMLYRDTFSSNDALRDSLNTQGEMRKAFREMSSAIRSASPSSLGAYPIFSASSTAFIFYSDADLDGLKERIRYFLSGNILKKGILIPVGNPLVYSDANEKISPFILGVASSSVFSYYDGNYDGTTAPLLAPVNLLSVRLVKINVVIDKDPAKPPAEMEFTAQVSIRNLKDN
jgi:type II secretory pathway pseudopilin PulG